MVRHLTTLVTNDDEYRSRNLTANHVVSPTAPIVNELLSDETCTFYFVDAPCEAVPPKGFEDFFGAPPYYRFIEPDDKDGEETDVLSRIRDFPDCDTAEDTIRELFKEGVASSVLSTIRSIEYLFKIMEEEGPFEGIIGYSEGAIVAGTLLLHEQRRQELEGRIPMLKCAIFFAGWPPLDPSTYAMVLSDESDTMINIHTCHISKCFFLLRYEPHSFQHSCPSMSSFPLSSPTIAPSNAIYVCIERMFFFV